MFCPTFGVNHSREMLLSDRSSALRAFTAAGLTEIRNKTSQNNKQCVTILCLKPMRLEFRERFVLGEFISKNCQLMTQS